MRLETPGRDEAEFVRPVSRVPAVLGRSAGGLAAPDPIADPFPNADAAPARSDQHVARVDMAQQCRSWIEGLSPRQRDVLVGLVAGHSNKQMARTLGISPRTIEVYRAGLMDRLNVRTLAQVLHIAFVAGLTFDTIS